MIRTFYTLILFAISNLANGQITFSYVGSGTESRVLKHLDKVASDKDNIASGYKFNSTKKGDTLVLSVTGPERNTRRLTFNGNKKTCDFDQIILPTCDNCTKSQVEIFLNNKQMKWKEIAKNAYLSSIIYHTILNISYDTENFCTIMTFKDLKLDRTEYLDLYGNYGEYATTKSMNVPVKPVK